MPWRLRLCTVVRHMVLTRSQHRRVSSIETETLPDDEFWALEAALRTAEEASDAIPPVVAVPMQMSMARVPLSPGALGRLPAASASWLPAPEPRRPDAQHPEPRSSIPPTRHSPRRRFSAPAALVQRACVTALPASVATDRRALAATAPVRLPAGSLAGKAPAAANQHTLHQIYARRRSASDVDMAGSGSREAAARTAVVTKTDAEALQLPDPREAMRRRSKSALSGRRRSQRKSGNANSGPAALQVGR